MPSRTIRVLLVALVLVAMCAPIVVWAAAPPDPARHEVSVRSIDVREYPRVVLSLAVPPGLSGRGDDGVAYAVRENGMTVDATRIDGDDSAPRRTPAVTLCLDVSGSMKGAPLRAAIEAAHGFLGAIPRDARVALVSFGEDAVVQAETGSPESADRMLAGLEAKGETALYDAVALAAKQFPVDATERYLIVLSDGGDTASSSDFAQAARAVDTVDATVYAIALTSPEANHAALRNLATRSGGRLLTTGAASGLSSHFKSTAEEISATTLIEYTSLNPATKDIELDLEASTGDSVAVAHIAFANPRFSAGAADGAGANPVSVIADRPVLMTTAILASGLAVALFVWALVLLLYHQHTALGNVSYYDQLHAAEQGASGVQGAAEKLRERMEDTVGVVAAKGGTGAAVQRLLTQAGLHMRANEYLALQIMAVALVGASAWVASRRVELSVLAVIIAAVGPLMALRFAGSRRRHRFDDQLPDVLQMIAGSLRGGWGVGQAIDFVAHEVSDPAASELRRVQTETRLGLPLEQALAGMAERMDSDDFRWAVTAIGIQREVGGNLAEVLDTVATTVRERAALGRHVRALTAEGRMSAGILIALPFLEGILLMVVSPEYLQPMFTTPQGIGTTIFGTLLLVVGAVWLTRAMNVEV